MRVPVEEWAWRVGCYGWLLWVVAMGCLLWGVAMSLVCQPWAAIRTATATPSDNTPSQHTVTAHRHSTLSHAVCDAVTVTTFQPVVTANRAPAPPPRVQRHCTPSQRNLSAPAQHTSTAHVHSTRSRHPVVAHLYRGNRPRVQRRAIHHHGLQDAAYGSS